MDTPLLALLGFATWTLVVLMTTVGVHRWRLILSGRAAVNSFPADGTGGPDWYQRATRAHANCVENLPVFGALVAIAALSGVHGATMDRLATIVLVARVLQTSVHVAFVQTARAVSFRFTFFAVQLVAMLGMAVTLLAAR